MFVTCLVIQMNYLVFSMCKNDFHSEVTTYFENMCQFDVRDCLFNRRRKQQSWKVCDYIVWCCVSQTTENFILLTNVFQCQIPDIF